MLNDNALTTFERIRDRLELDDSKRSFIEDAINVASAVIERFCNRRFELGIYTDIVPEAEDEHIFSQYPVHSVVSINGEPLDDPFLDTESGILYRAISGRSRIAYQAGYSLPRHDSQLEPFTLPADIELACIRLVQFVYGDEDTVSELDMQTTLKSFDLGDFRATLGGGGRPDHLIPSDVQSLLTPYRKVNL